MIREPRHRSTAGKGRPREEVTPPDAIPVMICSALREQSHYAPPSMLSNSNTTCEAESIRQRGAVLGCRKRERERFGSARRPAGGRGRPCLRLRCRMRTKVAREQIKVRPNEHQLRLSRGQRPRRDDRHSLSVHRLIHHHHSILKHSRTTSYALADIVLTTANIKRASHPASP